MYEIKHQDMDIKKWKNKKYDDYYFIKEISNSLIDNVGIIGEELFELSLDSLGSSFDMGLAPIRGFGVNEIEAYNFMCPELETFVSVVLWLNYDNESSTCKNENFGEILYDYIEKKDVNKKCVIKGNYRLRNEHFSDVLPFHGSIEIRKKHDSYYEWERAPFLKRSAEVCTYDTSSLFMSSFPDDTTGVSKISIFTMPFKCRQIKNNSLEIIIPSCTTYHQALMNVQVANKSTVKELDNNPNEFHMGLFREKIVDTKGYWRIFELINISDAELTSNDLLGHFISQRMYYIYLKNNHLKICTSKELEKYIKVATHQIYKNYDVEPNHFFDFEIFKLVYLNKYFVEINDCWYYKPYIFKNLNNEQYALFLEYLEGKFSYKEYTGYDMLEKLEMEKRFNKYSKYLNFLNIYNQYSKRDLINIINKGGGYKWRIPVQK
jgi:hypothetical protein